MSNMADMDDLLPGRPKKSIVREVRKHLKHYGIIPNDSHLWRETWAWAYKIKCSYAAADRYPIPNEIGAMYLFLLLALMNKNFALKLPYRAMKEPTPMVAALMATNNQPQLDYKEAINGRTGV